MGRQKIRYKLVGRYVRGNDTVYYVLESETGARLKYTEEQMAFVVGREQVVNVEAQLYKDKVLFRGINCDIKGLPTVSLGEQNNIINTQGRDNNINIQGRNNNTNKLREKTKEINTRAPKPFTNEMMINIGYSLAHDMNVLSLERNYETVCGYILTKYHNYAYRLTETRQFRDYPMGCLHIDGVDTDGLAYFVSVDKWEPSATVHDKVKLIVSKSTLAILKYEYPEYIKSEYKNNIDKSQYKYCHYHELVIRMGLFSKIPQFKKLKAHFIKYNKQVFDDKINHKLSLIAFNYDQEEGFEKFEKCGGYFREGENFIALNFKYVNSIDNIEGLDSDDTFTLLHEMTHAFVYEIHGTNDEMDPNKRGDVLYGMDRNRYGEQCNCHGEKFGNALRMVSQKTHLKFSKLFGYRVKIEWEGADQSTIETKSHSSIERDLLPDRVFTTRIASGDELALESRFNYRMIFEKIKSKIVEKQDELSEYFSRKCNMQLIWNITDDNTFVSTRDCRGIIRNYDINYDKNLTGRPALLLYRLFEGERSAMLYHEPLSNATVKVIKTLLEKVYIDTITD